MPASAYPNHQNIRPAYVQPTDPGAVKAGVFWVDTSPGVPPYKLYVRNRTDTGWDLLSTGAPVGPPGFPEEGEEGEPGPPGPAAPCCSSLARIVGPIMIEAEEGEEGSPGTSFAGSILLDLSPKRVSGQFDKVDATLAPVPGLSVDVIAGHSYSFEACLFVDADATGGSKFAIAGSCTASAVIYEIALIDDAGVVFTITSRQTALGGSAGQAGTTAGFCRIKGLVSVSASGTLLVQFAQNAANGTSSVLVGSDFIVKDNP